MRISDLEFYQVDWGLARDSDPARSTLVRLATDSGLEGWGEADTRWPTGQLAARRSALLPLVAGRSVFDVEELQTLGGLDDAPLRSAVEMALWDIIGHAADQPLCHLWGGRYRSRIPVAARLPEKPADDVQQIARELADQGVHCQIISCSEDARDDLETFSAVRAAVGDRAELRLDGGGRFDLETAREACRRVENDRPEFFLDPLAADDLSGPAQLRRQVDVPLALGRAIRGPADVLAAVRSAAASHVVIDLARVGGILAARKCAAIAEAGGVLAALAAAPSVGIAAAAVLQLAAATPGFSTANECAAHPLREGILTERLEQADGMLAVPQGPGLGIRIDRRRLERWQVTT